MAEPEDWEAKYRELHLEHDALIAAHEDITAFLAHRNDTWKQRAMRTARNSADHEIALEYERLAVIFEGVAEQYERGDVKDARQLTPQSVMRELAAWLRDGAGRDENEAAAQAEPTPVLRVVPDPPVTCPYCSDGADDEGWQCMRCRGTGLAAGG